MAKHLSTTDAPATPPAPAQFGAEHASTHHDEIKEFLTGFQAFWARFGNAIMIVILIVLATVLLYRWLSGREERIREEAYLALIEAQVPLAKQEVAMRYEHVPGLAGKARLEAADMLFQEALAPASGALATAGPPPRKEKLDQAASLYERVIQMNDSPLQVAAARFGLAAVHETLCAFEKAREQYELIQKNADTEPVLAERAKQMAATLDEIQRPIVFPPPPPPPAVTGPQIPGAQGAPGSGFPGLGLPGVMPLPSPDGAPTPPPAPVLPPLQDNPAPPPAPAPAPTPQPQN